MAKVSIYIRDSYKNKNGIPLYLRAYISGKYVYINLNVLVAEANHFNKQKQIVTGGKNRKQKNNLIQDAKGKASDIILKYQVNERMLTPELFRKEFLNPSVFQDFIAFMESEIHKRKGELAVGTIKHNLSTLRKLKLCFPDGIMMAEFDQSVINRFHRYLVKNNLSMASITRQMKTVKTYTNRAIKLELIEKDPFLFYKIRKQQKLPVFLTIEERDKLYEIYQANYLDEGQQKVLRWFLFSCFTGVRISDIQVLKYNNVRNKSLVFHPVKTQNVNNKKIEVPLTKKALQLMKDEHKNRLKGPIFDTFQPPVINRYIKKIVKQAGIDKEVTFHTARHTFATSFLKQSKNANGILILKNLLGHAKLESTMVYSHIINHDVHEAMQDFS